MQNLIRFACSQKIKNGIDSVTESKFSGVFLNIEPPEHYSSELAASHVPRLHTVYLTTKVLFCLDMNI